MKPARYFRGSALALAAAAIAAFAQPATAQQPYKIGAMLDVTGSASFLGKPEHNAVMLAVEEGQSGWRNSRQQDRAGLRGHQEHGNRYGARCAQADQSGEGSRHHRAEPDRRRHGCDPGRHRGGSRTAMPSVGCRPDDGENLRLIDQLARSEHRIGFRALGVLEDQLDLVAANSASLIGLLPRRA